VIRRPRTERFARRCADGGIVKQLTPGHRPRAQMYRNVGAKQKVPKMPNHTSAPARFDRPTALLVRAGLGLGKAFRWLREEWRRNVEIHGVNPLPDYLLKDAGVERRNIDWIADEKVKRLREGMNW
jgi:hypothetical protein